MTANDVTAVIVIVVIVALNNIDVGVCELCLTPWYQPYLNLVRKQG